MTAKERKRTPGGIQGKNSLFAFVELSAFL